MMLSAWTGSAAVALYGMALAVQGIAGLPLWHLRTSSRARVGTNGRARNTRELARFSGMRPSVSPSRRASPSFSSQTIRALLVLLFGAGYGAADSALEERALTLFAAWAGPNEAMLRATGLSGSILTSRLITAVVAGTAAPLC